MKEDFLHHVWQHKKFAVNHLKTTTGESIQILNSGQLLQLAGPDFFNAQLIIGNQKWAGNIEIHLKSSDWYLHHHEKDPAYDSVILHVVWEHDTPIFRNDNSEIPTLELNKYVPITLVQGYQTLLQQKRWIYCENEIASIPDFMIKQWLTRLFIERMERKALEIEDLLRASNNDWEAVLFRLLAKNFGLNSNGAHFLAVANSIPFAVIRKEANSLHALEALLYGQANLLDQDFQDEYAKRLQQEFEYLSLKYGLKKNSFTSVTFFKHRPDNFPTIRLAQLAALYHKECNLFSKLMKAPDHTSMYTLLSVSINAYWTTHYNFDKMSKKKRRTLSTSFLNLMLINTILPIKYAYEKSRLKQNDEQFFRLMESLPSEKNAIMDHFATIGVVSNSAFESQALLQLKKEYCEVKKCLQCAVGLQILKN
jgi:hypothetical protein